MKPNRLTRAVILLPLTLLLFQEGAAQLSPKKAVTDTMIQNFQPASNRLSHLTPASRPVRQAPELVNAYRWWRSINPYDMTKYTSPYNLAPHSSYDTTINRFAAKQSLSFKGWLYREGWPLWQADSLVHLLALKNLVQLDLPLRFVNDTAFRILGRIPQLKAISYHSGTAYYDPNSLVTDNGLAALLQNTALEYVGFQNLAAITDAGFAHFGRLKNLKQLHTQGWKGITDAALLALEGCSALETLYLVNSNITDQGLTNLLQIKSKLPNLTKLYLNDSKVTASGIASFQKDWGRPITIGFVYHTQSSN
jgi:Leucine-rich repeat (LRR) protein